MRNLCRRAVLGIPLTAACTCLLSAVPLLEPVGDARVPPPKDMVDVSDYSENFRAFAKALPKKPFGLYYLIDELQDLDAGTGTLASRWAIGSAATTFSTEDEARSQFAKKMAGADTDFTKSKLSSAEFRDILRSSERLFEAKVPALKVKMAGMSVLDTEFSKPGRAMVVCLVNSSIALKGKKIEATIVYCMGWQLVGRTVLTLNYNVPLKDPKTPGTAKEALEAWMDAIVKRSAQPEERNGEASASRVGRAAVRQQEPRIPAPRGYLEASGMSESLRRSACSGLTPPARCLGLYYDTNSLAELLRTGHTDPAPFFKAVLDQEYASVDDAKGGFQTTVGNARTESRTRFDAKDPDVQRILEDAAKNAKRATGVGASVVGGSMLGVLIDDPDTFATMSLVNFAVSDQEGTFVMAMALTRIGPRQFTFATLFPFKNAASVEGANGALRDWLRIIRDNLRE
jgi:hypothetical protein